MSSTKRRPAEDLGALASRRRDELGEPQEVIAGRAGITVSYLSRIENGHQIPTVEKCPALASALSLPVSDVIAARKATIDAWDAAKLAKAAS